MASSQGRPIDINACNDLCRVYNYTLKCLELKCSAESLQRRFNATNETLPWTSGKEICKSIFTTMHHNGGPRDAIGEPSGMRTLSLFALSGRCRVHTSNHGDSQEEVWNCSSASKTDGKRLTVSVVISKLHQVYSAINDNSQNHFSRHRQIVDGSVII